MTKKNINEVIMTVILTDFNLQTRPKMRARFGISSSTDTNKKNFINGMIMIIT